MKWIFGVGFVVLLAQASFLDSWRPLPFALICYVQLVRHIDLDRKNHKCDDKNES